MKILITDGETRAALAATRSLAGKGHEIILAGIKKINISSVSKYCGKSFGGIDFTENKKESFSKIKRIIADEKVEIILPITETSVIALAEKKDSLEPEVILASPSIEIIRKLYSKYNLFIKASEKGVAIPETVFIEDRADFFSKKSEDFSFPAVVKPSLSQIPEEDGFISTGVKFVSNNKELQELYKNNQYLDHPSLIQEKIEGPGTGLFTLFDGQEHLALFSHKRLREKPPWGGVSVFSESVELDPEMVEASKMLLSAVGWRGVAMVEFKRDNRDGKAKLMEINGRFWGSLELAIISGVDFPALYIDFLLGEKANLPKDYRKSQKLKWILGDLDNHFIRWKTGWESKLSLVAEFLKIKDRSTTFDVLKLKDIKPFILEAKDYVFDLLRLNK